MERIDRIIKHTAFVFSCEQNERNESERIFCKHDPAHFLDVARIALILNYERKYVLTKEMIYAAALLHDCGRYVQYECQIPHEEAALPIAEKILKDCDFDKNEADVILQAIALHRNKEEARKYPLADLIYSADKLSRDCYFCKASEECNWKKDKKNKTLRY